MKFKFKRFDSDEEAGIVHVTRLSLWENSKGGRRWPLGIGKLGAGVSSSKCLESRIFIIPVSYVSRMVGG
jgi:hypothetical protein